MKVGETQSAKSGIMILRQMPRDMHFDSPALDSSIRDLGGQSETVQVEHNKLIRVLSSSHLVPCLSTNDTRLNDSELVILF